MSNRKQSATGKNGRAIRKHLETSRKTYPLRKKKAPMAKEPEWAIKLDEWGTNKEIEHLECANKKKYSTTGNRKKRTGNGTTSQISSTIGNYISMERRRKISPRDQR